MKYGLTKHPLVDDDLFEILGFIANYSGLQIATRKVAAIISVINNLLDFPFIGSLRQDIHPGLRAIPAGQKAVVCFTVDDATRTVFIICVTYAGADWEGRVTARS
ncbi:MAG: type II toxin-antitoxin system RelE/ParE family toxin [Allorhizobium sp.]